MLAEFTAIARARREELPPRYYTRRRVRFVVSPAPGGWSIVPAGNGDGIFLPVPTVYRSGAKPPPMLIADTALYVFGVPKDDTERDRRFSAARHADYVTLLGSFAAACPDDPVAAQLAAFAHSPFPAVLAGRLTELGGTSADLVAFSADGGYAHLTPAARDFWTAEVTRRKSTGTEAVCCICGQAAPALSSLPESVPGSAIPVTDSAGRPVRGQPAQLVSINNAAQGRAGAIQLVNTPICPDCGGDSVAALTHLLGEERSRRRNRDSALIWWSSGSVLDEEDLLGHLDRPDPDSVSRLLAGLSRPGTGEFFISSQARRFRAVALAANKSRIIVRDQVDISLDKLGANLTAWFADHRIDAGRGDSAGSYAGIWQLAAATGRPSGAGAGYLPGTQFKGIEDDLLRCALNGAPPPPGLLPNMLHRITRDGVISAHRAALIRLSLRRSLNPSPEDATMTGLNPDAPDSAYQCGRLFRVLENIQQTAIPEISTTLADRNRAVSRNPALLAGLVENSRAHLRRLHRRKQVPAAIALETRLDEVLERIGNSIPARFTITEQGRFVLGYHHQRAWDRRQREAAAAAKQAREAGKDPQPGQS
jgi:CRISPR-associated protein Csd1